MTTLLALCLCAQPVPPPAVQFDAITLADARQLDGRTVRIEFRPGKPSYTWPGPLRTFTGPVELDDDQERTVVLRVIDHPAAAVNGVVIPAWSEIRFEEQ